MLWVLTTGNIFITVQKIAVKLGRETRAGRSVGEHLRMTDRNTCAGRTKCCLLPAGPIFCFFASLFSKYHLSLSFLNYKLIE